MKLFSPKYIVPLTLVTLQLIGFNWHAGAQELPVMTPEQARSTDGQRVPTQQQGAAGGSTEELPVAESFEALDVRRRVVRKPKAEDPSPPAKSETAVADEPKSKTDARPVPKADPKPTIVEKPAPPVKAPEKSDPAPRQVTSKPPLPKLKPPRDSEPVTVEIIHVGPPVTTDAIFDSAVGVELNPDDDQESGVTVVESFSEPQSPERALPDRR